jgi:putative ABC transport system ATP-binding protein
MPVLEAFDLYRFYHAREEETLALRGVSIHVG